MIINRAGKEELFELTIYESIQPEAFKARVEDLVESGLSRDEAEIEAHRPILMEMYYMKGGGVFCVEAESLDCSKVFNPYTGREMISEEDLNEELGKRFRSIQLINNKVKQMSYDEWRKDPNEGMRIEKIIREE